MGTDGPTIDADGAELRGAGRVQGAGLRQGSRRWGEGCSGLGGGGVKKFEMVE